MTEQFYIGQTFDRPAPPEAVAWCNNNHCRIDKNGNIRTIVEKPALKTTVADLVEFLYQEKCKVAYGGVTVVKSGTKHLFETNQDSITMCNSMALAMANQPDDFTVSWKVWAGDVPIMLTITKAEFNAIFAFGMLMINTAFGVEGVLNEQAQILTDEQLADAEFVDSFKQTVIQQFEAVNTVFSLDLEETETEE